MKHYARILRYLKPHAPVFATAVVATFIFAGLDAFSIALLIPFLRTIFRRAPDASDGSGATPGGSGTGGQGMEPSAAAAGQEEGFLEDLLDGTVGRIVDLDADPQVAIRGIILFILVVFAVKNIFDFIRAYLVARVEQGVTRDLRNQVYDHLLDLDLAFFGRTKMGQIVSRLTHDVEQLRTLLTKELGKVISSVFEFGAAVVFMVAISLKLTLAAFVVIPATMVMWGPLVGKLRKGDRRVLNIAGEVNAHIQETLAGIRLVKSSAAEPHERNRFHGLTQHYFKTFVRTERLRALAAPITEMLAAIGTVILLWYGARLVLVGGELSGEMFIVFLGLSMKLYAPVKYLSKFPALVQPGLVGAERVFEFLDAPIEIRDRSGAKPFPGLDREITYEDVHFAYRAGEPVLEGISLTVPKGSVIALVGPSGGGKTTLVDLLGRFYEVSGGRVAIDGTDIREFGIQSLRETMGFVSQETILFHDTVRANIAYGMAEASQDAIERAATAAHAHDFIAKLPQGYETVVGERGTELSGGQRQRLAIARAILRDPPILVLDEATSSLDTEAERLVQEAIERLLTGRTVFVIAHRLSTVQRANEILVVDQGRIVERGGHDSLMALEGQYKRLHDLQFWNGDEAAESLQS